MTLGRCPLSIFCPRGTPPTVEPTNPESITPLNIQGLESRVQGSQEPTAVRGSGHTVPCRMAGDTVGETRNLKKKIKARNLKKKRKARNLRGPPFRGLDAARGLMVRGLMGVAGR